MIASTLLEKNLLPDGVIRQGIKRLLRQRLRDENLGNPELQAEKFWRLIDELKRSPIAVQTRAANEQHYEVPTAFYQQVLGRHMKYSCGYWEKGVTDLDQSESDMLRLTAERAQLANGQDVLELGCGWGSLSLFMAEHYPASQITAVSNSRTQKDYIDGQAKTRQLTNLTIVTADINDFYTEKTFDRVVSVEMFEHMRNYQELMSRIAGWLRPAGKMFVHIFTHREYAYLFEEKDETDWMSKYFFTGGVMPSDSLLLHFQSDLRIDRHWRVKGTHYAKTSEAWLARMDQHRATIFPIFEKAYGPTGALKWWVYWRIFFMSCAELWAFADGGEWFVSHYRFQKP